MQNVLQTVVTGTSPAPSTGVLTANATFTVAVTDESQQQPVSVPITAASTQGNQSVTDLINEINTAMANAGVSSAITAGVNSQGEITFTDSNGNPLQITASAGNSLGLATQASGTSLRSAIVGLPTNVNTTALIDVVQDLTSAAVASTTAAGLSTAMIAAAGSLSDAIAAVNANYPAVSTASLVAVLTELQNAAPSVQSLQTEVNSILTSSLSSSLDGNVTVSFVQGPPTAGTDEAVEIAISLSPSNYAQSVPLSSLNLSGLGPLTISGSGAVTVTVGGSANINFGYDLTTSTPFLLGSTNFGLMAQIASSNLTLSADIGSVGVSIGNSSHPASISLTNAASTPNSAASISVTTTVGSNAWIPFSQLTAGTFQLNSTGGLLSATLPIYLGSTLLGNQPLTVSLNLQNPAQPTIILPPNLQSSLDGGGFDFTQLIGASGISGFLTDLQNSIQAQLEQLPLIGHDLNLGSGLIADLQSKFLTPLQNAVNSVSPTDPNYFQDLKTAVLNAITTSLGSLLVGSPNVPLPTSDALQMTFEVKGSDSYTTSFNTNLGGLGLNISSQGGVTLNLGYDLHLGFALSKTEGFSFIVQPDSNGNAFTFAVSAGLTPGTKLQAKLFVLNVSATNETTTDNGVGTGINGSLSLNIGSGNMSLGQLASALASATVTASLTADINLHLTADVDPSLPNIQADLSVHFPIFDTSSGMGDVGSASQPSVALDNVTLGFGSFLNNIIGPVVNDISKVLAPITPILNFLTGDVPGISTLTEMAGIGPVTWADLLEAVAEYEGADIDFSAFNDAIDVLQEVSGFAKDIQQMSASGGINFGNFNFTADLRNDDSVSGTSNVNSLGNLNEVDGSPEGQVASDTGASGSSDWSGLSSSDGGLNFPVLDNPSSLVGLLLGKSVDLVTWTLPSISLDLNFAEPLVEVTFFGIVHAEVDLIGGFGMTLGGDTIGFDTSGLTTGNFANGFYMDNQPILSLNAGIGVGASVGIGISGLIGAGFGLGGELDAQINVGLSDPSGNPKIYFDQLQSHCALQLSGSLSVQMVAYLTESYIVGSSTQQFTISPPLTLFSFSTSCPPVNLAHVYGQNSGDSSLPLPPGASAPPAGTLVLNVGPDSSLRSSGAADGVAPWSASPRSVRARSRFPATGSLSSSAGSPASMPTRTTPTATSCSIKALRFPPRSWARAVTTNSRAGPETTRSKAAATTTCSTAMTATTP